MGAHQTAWTHELRVRMPPRAQSLRAFGDYLEALDRLSDVRWRSIAEGTASLAVGSNLQVTVGPSVVELMAYRLPLGECATAVLELLQEVVAPPVVRMLTRSQHLVPYRGLGYSEATERAAREWLSPLRAFPGVRDCAVLLDGDVPEVDGHYQVEYGVVESSEVHDRLLRVFGRVEGRGSAPEPPRELDYPEVAVFADFSWHFDGPILAVVGSDSCLARASATLQYANEFVDMVNQGLMRAGEGGV